MPPIVHVAGTNGKGSVVAFLESILTAHGYSAHTYTSPHLVRFHERIKLARGQGELPQPIDEGSLVEFLEACERANAGDAITFFEITTVLALYAFAQTPADFVLLEVGLGGRFDATNVIQHPAVSVITPVGLDHTDFLGDSIDRIAWEKAGIIKPERPVIMGKQTPQAKEVIESVAEERRALLVAEGRDYRATRRTEGFAYESARAAYDLPSPGLAGPHQVDNAATSIAALEHLGSMTLDQASIGRGLVDVRWPGRLQRLNGEWFPELNGLNAELWLDGGHNPSAGRVLKDFLNQRQIEEERALYIVQVMPRTKDLNNFLAAVASLKPILIGTDIEHESAFFSASEIKGAAEARGLKAYAAPQYRAALRLVADLEAKEPQRRPVRILLCGSLYQAGQVLYDLERLRTM